jgi:hypothetical protein
MENIVPYFKPFTTIFYFKIFELGKVLFETVKVWKDLKFIWISLNSNFESNRRRRPALWPPGPDVGDTASPVRRRPRVHAPRARYRQGRAAPGQQRRPGTTPGPPRPPPPHAPSTLKGIGLCRAQSFLPAPPFSRKEHTESTPTSVASCPSPTTEAIEIGAAVVATSA